MNKNSKLQTLHFLLYLGTSFAYPEKALSLEVFALVAFAFLQAARFYIGSRGNKLEQSITLLIFIGLTSISSFGYLFYLLWQTYVLLIDVVISSVGLLFILVECVTASNACYVLNKNFK